MSSVKLDATALQTWILQQLGAPIVQPQLTECHLAQAIEEAQSWFISKRGMEVEVLLPCAPGGTQVLDLPSDADTVLDVAFEEPANSFALSYLGTPLEADAPLVPLYSSAKVMGAYSALVQTIQHHEESRRALSLEPDWEQVGPQLRLFAVPLTTTKVWVKYTTTALNIERLTEREARLIRRMALVQAKKILTQIRGIYDSGFQGSQGTTTFNLSILDTTDEESKLDEEILALGPPLGVLTG